MEAVAAPVAAATADGKRPDVEHISRALAGSRFAVLGLAPPVVRVDEGYEVAPALLEPGRERD